MLNAAVSVSVHPHSYTFCGFSPCPCTTTMGNLPSIDAFAGQQASSHAMTVRLPMHPSSSLFECHDYQKYIFGGPRALCVLGPLGRLVFIMDVASCSEVSSGKPNRDCLPLSLLLADSRYQQAMLNVAALLEQFLQLMDQVIGHVPALTHPFHGRVRVEVGDIGAAGLAHHGRAGIAVGPAYVRIMLEAALQGRRLIHHVFGYEFFRNYVQPEVFTHLLDYSCAKGACQHRAMCGSASGRHCPTDPSSTGWVNQGFVDILGCLLVDQLPGVSFDYYGQDRAAFRAGMEADLAQCIGGDYTWEQVFLHDRLPWNPARSLDNVYAGLLSVLYSTYGDARWVRRWFMAIRMLVNHPYTRASREVRDYHTAADNFYLAASAAAGADLTTYFTEAYDGRCCLQAVHSVQLLCTNYYGTWMGGDSWLLWASLLCFPGCQAVCE